MPPLSGRRRSYFVFFLTLQGFAFRLVIQTLVNLSLKTLRFTVTVAFVIVFTCLTSFRSLLFRMV